MKKNLSTRFFENLKKSSLSFLITFPVIIGVILLIGFIKNFVNIQKLSSFFDGYLLRDTVIGSIFGSIFAGHPSNSYILSEELLENNISLYAVTAFLISWVTVGFIQIPAEISFFGKKFTIMRNLFAVLFSIIIAILVGLTMGVMSWKRSSGKRWRKI